ncbi:hypothetical protein ACTA71_006138 [Dictyostelium dimigraforme]
MEFSKGINIQDLSCGRENYKKKKVHNINKENGMDKQSLNNDNRNGDSINGNIRNHITTNTTTFTGCLISVPWIHYHRLQRHLFTNIISAQPKINMASASTQHLLVIISASTH